MKKLFLIAILFTIPALAQSSSENKPLPQDTQIKLLKAQRQLEQIQLKVDDLERQYKEALKQANDLKIEMNDDCTAAAKQSNVDLTKFTCDLDSLTFAPRPELRKPEATKPEPQK